MKFGSQKTPTVLLFTSDKDQTKFAKTIMASRTYLATYTSYFTSYLSKASKTASYRRTRDTLAADLLVSRPKISRPFFSSFFVERQ